MSISNEEYDRFGAFILDADLGVRIDAPVGYYITNSHTHPRDSELHPIVIDITIRKFNVGLLTSEGRDKLESSFPVMRVTFDPLAKDVDLRLVRDGLVEAQNGLDKAKLAVSETLSKKRAKEQREKQGEEDDFRLVGRNW